MERRFKKLTQFAVTQVLDRVRQIFGRTCRCDAASPASFVGDDEVARTVLVENRSGVVSLGGSRPMALS